MWKKVFSALLVPGLVLGVENTGTFDGQTYVSVSPGGLVEIGEGARTGFSPTYSLEGGYRMRSGRWGVDASAGITIFCSQAGVQGLFYPHLADHVRVYMGAGLRGYIVPLKNFYYVRPCLSIGVELPPVKGATVSFWQLGLEPRAINYYRLNCDRPYATQAQLSYGFSF